MGKLYIKNSSGNPGFGCPVSINGISYIPSIRDGSIDLKDFTNKGITSILVNGARKTFKPALLVQSYTRLRFQHLMSRNPSFVFTDETEHPTNSDNIPLLHFELSLGS